jgi:hypothetical protein
MIVNLGIVPDQQYEVSYRILDATTISGEPLDEPLSVFTGSGDPLKSVGSSSTGGGGNASSG